MNNTWKHYSLKYSHESQHLSDTVTVWCTEATIPRYFKKDMLLKCNQNIYVKNFLDASKTTWSVRSLLDSCFCTLYFALLHFDSLLNFCLKAIIRCFGNSFRISPRKMYSKFLKIYEKKLELKCLYLQQELINYYFLQVILYWFCRANRLNTF